MYEVVFTRTSLLSAVRFFGKIVRLLDFRIIRRINLAKFYKQIVHISLPYYAYIRFLFLYNNLLYFISAVNAIATKRKNDVFDIFQRADKFIRVLDCDK